MKLMLTIAWRNILRHMGKSLVIGAILFTGAFLMTLGNGVISGMAHGVEHNIINGFMGDIVLISDSQKFDNVLLEMMGTSVEPITGYKKIKEVLSRQPYVSGFLPAGKNLAAVLNENDTTPALSYLIGVDFAEYQRMFPDNFKVLEGKTLKPGERALLMPAFSRDKFYDFSNVWYLPEGGSLVKENLKKEALDGLQELVISSSVVMMGMTSGINTTNDIRYPVRGIIKFRALNQIFGNFCIVDIESYRECLGYFSSADMSAQVPKEETNLLGMEGDDLDSLFGNESMIVADSRTAPRNIKAEKAVVKDAEEGVYNLVFVKLKPGVSYKTALAGLNSALSGAGTGVRAISWNKASGPIGSMELIIKSALFLFVMLLFCVAVIIIVNTLTMAAIERAAEIGMMRAVGAHKTFIAGMFLGETAILSAVFGGGGIVAGIAAVRLIPLFKITTENDMLQLLYGGPVFSPLLSLSGIGLTVLQLLFVTVIAALYPMRVAAHITPLDAISRD